MNRKKLILLTVLFFLLSINLIAQADLEKNVKSSDMITFNSQNHTYHLTSSVPYMSQTLEQKFLAIQSINAFEEELEQQGVVTQ